MLSIATKKKSAAKHLRSRKNNSKKQVSTKATEQHSELGKAIIEGLDDVKHGRVTRIKRENLDSDIRSMIEED